MEHLVDLPPPARRIFCNRTLNLRSIGAIGFDMDYTLVHYHTVEWERRAYEHAKQKLVDRGWPVAHLVFDPEAVALGLIADLERGNVLKANRFGYVKRAAHGERMLSFDEQRTAYAGVLVDLEEPRWVFINTLFGISETCLFSQLVDLLDAGKIHEVLGYRDLYQVVRASIDATHMEGALKREIVGSPEAYVERDPELALALLDLKHAGKKLLLITNSEWPYTRALMGYVFDSYLPRGTSWRDLFHFVIVGARKPSFFTQPNPFFEIVDEARGLCEPHVGELRPGRAYLGGNAAAVERNLGLSGDDILYVGDHIFADVHITKNLLRWRTALVVRALEQDLSALESFHEDQRQIQDLMARKEHLEHNFSLLRIQLQRLEQGYGPPPAAPPEALRSRIHALRAELVELDQRIAPIAKRASTLSNARWGLLMRAGNDKSHLARQIERYADVYMSRVSNLLLQTPFVYLRAPGGSLPHDGQPGDDPVTK